MVSSSPIIDIEIREHNKIEINKSRFSNMITLIEGSSIDQNVFEKVSEKIYNDDKVMVFLDSNHTHNHVLEELKAYAHLVSPESYCVVFDTIIENLPKNSSVDRPWSVGNNPKTAVWEFLKTNHEFAIDFSIQNKLIITVAPDGYLKRK